VTAALSAVIDIVDSINPHFSNSALSAAKSHRATLLAEPFPGRWLKGLAFQNAEK
jgi:hypothetical protein